jgi:hypothetical protein
MVEEVVVKRSFAISHWSFGEDVSVFGAIKLFNNLVNFLN